MTATWERTMTNGTRAVGPTVTRLPDTLVAKAGRMRADRATYDEIAAELGLARRQTAHGAVQAAVTRGFITQDQLPVSTGSTRPDARHRVLPDFGAPAGVERDWRTEAACLDEDPELFYAVGGDWDSKANRVRAAEAKAVCARCPVADACLLDALNRGDDWAIRGGTTPDERRAMRARNDSRRTA